ncbi:MAG: hypothetical protein JWM16_1083 [Verrucomicrobiales bacterium]|nr:hypothetical protein [Verrucomicrobiales bacterium]
MRLNMYHNRNQRIIVIPKELGHAQRPPASDHRSNRPVSWASVLSLGRQAFMRTLHLSMFLFAASCCTVLSANPRVQVDAFSKLKQGDTLIVRFQTSGCFHEATHLLTFRRASELSVSIVKLAPDTARTGVVTTPTNRVKLGTLTLSKPDVVGLDRLINFYHSKHDSFCTTVDHITITQQRDGKTVATEEITDGSCQTFQMKMLTTFPELIGRLHRLH